MNNNERSWMYRRLENGFLTSEYCAGVEEFVSFALSNPECLLNGCVRCPCNLKKCQNKSYLDGDTVKFHLGRYGFVPNYYNWHFHGEQYVRPYFSNINMDVPSSSKRCHSPKSVNNMFKTVVGGKKKGRMYGCGSMASTLYPEEMAPSRRGGSSGVGRLSQSQEMIEIRNRLDASMRSNEELRASVQATQEENARLRALFEQQAGRMASLEEQVRALVAGMSQGVTAQSSGHTRLGPETSFRGCSVLRPSCRGSFVSVGTSAHASSSQSRRFSQSCVSPSQQYGYDDGNNVGDDDDETQTP